MATPIDWSDPCARAETLRQAKYRIISGQAESEFSYKGNGVERTVRYSQANLEMLESAIRDAEAECAEAMGLARPRRRYAIQMGGRRDR